MMFLLTESIFFYAGGVYFIYKSIKAPYTKQILPNLCLGTLNTKVVCGKVIKLSHLLSRSLWLPLFKRSSYVGLVWKSQYKL